MRESHLFIIILFYLNLIRFIARKFPWSTRTLLKVHFRVFPFENTFSVSKGLTSEVFRLCFLSIADKSNQSLNMNNMPSKN